MVGPVGHGGGGNSSSETGPSKLEALSCTSPACADDDRVTAGRLADDLHTRGTGGLHVRAGDPVTAAPRFGRPRGPTVGQGHAVAGSQAERVIRWLAILAGRALRARPARLLTLRSRLRGSDARTGARRRAEALRIRQAALLAARTLDAVTQDDDRQGAGSSRDAAPRPTWRRTARAARRGAAARPRLAAGAVVRRAAARQRRPGDHERDPNPPAANMKCGHVRRFRALLRQRTTPAPNDVARRTLRPGPSLARRRAGAPRWHTLAKQGTDPTARPEPRRTFDPRTK